MSFKRTNFKLYQKVYHVSQSYNYVNFAWTERELNLEIVY